MKTDFIKILFLALLVTGCSHIARIESKFEKTGEESYSPSGSCKNVPVYVKEGLALSESVKKAIGSALQITSSIPAHEVIGNVEVHAAPAASPERIFNTLIEKSCSAGADAIILTSIERHQVYGSLTGRKLVGLKNHHWYATAVRRSESN